MDLAVEVQLAGGLGNQLFQYATARALAARHGAKLRLDLSTFETDTLRRFELEAYSLSVEIAESAPPALRLPAVPGAGLASRIIERLRVRSTTVKKYREPHFHFDRTVLDLVPPVKLIGYWQSERYFLDHADLLRRELRLKEPIHGENATLAAEIEATTSVSLHVRRGDYVTNAHTNQYHGVCGLDYYARAVRHIAERVPDARLFVFSDDADWTRANLLTGLPTTYVIANPPDRGYRDMDLMRRCRHHIIANSSFSWWGAWLNPLVDKIVVAPSRWFGTAGNDTRDLLPPEWIRL